MARYNHFSKPKYADILFKEIPINGKFRTTKRNGKKVVRDSAMIKIDQNNYQEPKTKKIHHIAVPDNLIVQSYDILTNP